eukprot:scaffold375_cov378-Prasinococcus_capsulatus_cf.AAC.13
MVQDLKDMMDYYLDENQDDDFMGWDDDSIFEEFPFEKLENDVRAIQLFCCCHAYASHARCGPLTNLRLCIV